MTRIFKNKKIVFFAIVSLVLVALQVLVSIQLSSLGTKVYVLESTAESLAEENQKKSIEIMKLSSLSGLDSQKESYGFGKPEVVVYLSSKSESVAKLP